MFSQQKIQKLFYLIMANEILLPNLSVTGYTKTGVKKCKYFFKKVALRSEKNEQIF